MNWDKENERPTSLNASAAAAPHYNTKQSQTRSENSNINVHTYHDNIDHTAASASPMTSPSTLLPIPTQTPSQSFQSQSRPITMPTPGTRNHSIYQTRLRSVASSVVDHLRSLGVDASLSTLERDSVSAAHVLDRVMELIEDGVHAERETLVKQLTNDVATRDQMLAALKNEYLAIQKSFQLKESLLNEKAAILQEELLSTKAAETSNHSWTQNVIPRLQSQLQSYADAASREHALSASLSEELKKRDADLETTIEKYDTLSEQFLQLQTLTNTLNDRVLEQAAEVEILRSQASTREKQNASMLNSTSQTHLAEVHEWKGKYENVRAELTAQLQTSQAKEEQSTQKQTDQLQDLQQQLAEMKAKIASQSSEFEKQEALLKQDAEARVKSLEAQLAQLEEKSTAARAAQATQHDEKLQVILQTHAAELQYRASDASSGREKASAQLEALQAQLRVAQENASSVQVAREREQRDFSAQMAELKSSLASLREDHARIVAQFEITQRELVSTQQKYATSVAQFQNALNDDESKFLVIIESERKKYADSKRRWADEAHRLQRELQLQQEAMKETDAVNADLQRHVKSQADSMTMGAKREEELNGKIHQLQIQATATAAGSTRQLDELRQTIEKQALQLRERDVSLDRAAMERDSEGKRWHQELEMRLMQQKQAFMLERVAADKEVAAAKHATEAAKAEHESRLQVARFEWERESNQKLAELQQKNDEALLAVKASLPSQATIDAQVQVLVDAHISELNRVYMSPQSHAQIVESQLEALRFEFAKEKHQLTVENERKYADAQRSAESRLQSSLSELRSKYETEYSATMSEVRNGCREYEEQLENERQARIAAEDRADSATSALKDTQSALIATEGSLAAEIQSRHQFVDQLDQGGRVIDQLKALLTSERQANEQEVTVLKRAHEVEVESLRSASTSDVQHMAESHANAISSLRMELTAASQLAASQHAASMEAERDRSQRELQQLRSNYEQQLAEQSAMHHASMSQYRMESSVAIARLEAELVASKAAYDTCERTANQAANDHTFAMHQLQAQCDTAVSNAERQLLDHKNESHRVRELDRLEFSRLMENERGLFQALRAEKEAEQEQALNHERAVSERAAAQHAVERAAAQASFERAFAEQKQQATDALLASNDQAERILAATRAQAEASLHAVKVESEARLNQLQARTDAEIAHAHATMQRVEQESQLRETELREQSKESSEKFSNQLQERDDRIRQLEALSSQQTSVIARQERELASVARNQEGMVSEIATLREQHSQLQVTIREDLGSLYQTATDSLAQMHAVLQQQRRTIVLQHEQARDHQNTIDTLAHQVRESEEALVSAEARAADDIHALKQAQLLDRALGDQSNAASLREEIAGLHQRISDLQRQHADQLIRIREDHDAEYRDQLEHMEQLLRIRAGTSSLMDFVQSKAGETFDASRNSASDLRSSAAEGWNRESQQSVVALSSSQQPGRASASSSAAASVFQSVNPGASVSFLASRSRPSSYQDAQLHPASINETSIPRIPAEPLHAATSSSSVGTHHLTEQEVDEALSQAHHRLRAAQSAAVEASIEQPPPVASRPVSHGSSSSVALSAAELESDSASSVDSPTYSTTARVDSFPIVQPPVPASLNLSADLLLSSLVERVQAAMPQHQATAASSSIPVQPAHQMRNQIDTLLDNNFEYEELLRASQLNQDAQRLSNTVDL